MTKIKKLHHKRLNFPPQDVQSLRERIEAAPTNGIHEVLEPYTEWPFVRGDMYHWIPILNRFDEIMADANEKYKLAELQEVDFDSDTQKTLVSILRFSRLLLENCINRNLYSSVDRLDSLLNTSDPEVLENTLRLLLRASQRWSYQRDLRANQAVMSSRLLTLADPWHTKKDIAPPASSDAGGNIATHTNEFRLLARNENTELLKAHGGVIRYQFFRTAEDVEQLGEEAGASGPESAEPAAKETALPDARKKAGDSSSSSHRRTPSKKSHQPDSGRSLGAASEGLVSIHTPVSELGLDRSAGLHVQMRQAFAKLVAKYKVPRAHRYELRQRIYVALALFAGDSELRYTLLRSRIFSAAILSQLMNEREFKNAFLSREPNFTADIIGVLQPEVHAPLSVQTAVFLALDSLLKQRSEVSGAYVALNASANHGVLMFILRKAFTNVDGPPVFPYEFMSTLYFFLTGMANNMNGGQLLVSAGVVPVFVAALKHTHPQQLRSTGRVAKLLDYLISSTNSTFPAFCSANGIATLVERIHSEVQLAVAVSDANPEAAADLASPVALPPFSEYPVQLFRRREILPAEQIYLLKELFKLLTHLVQQPSYHDRLRNLVETTLPQTLCTVLNHPAAFGSNIYGMAISVSSMLVHNEPTSLPIIQEARLPETMLENLEKHIPYNSDVIMNIPGALGAFCLNDAGMEQVRSSSVISSTLRVFSDPDFIRILQEGDVTGSFGASLDEFMRHFPAVKEPVMDQVIEMLKSVLEMGQADSPLRQLNPGNTFLLRSAEGEELKPYYDDFYGMMLESVTTFLEGLLEQRAHSEMFMERGGWDLITQTIKSPMLPFSFVKSRTFDSLHGLASTLLDTSPERVFRSLFKVISELLIDESTSPTMMRTWPVANYLELANAAALSEPEYARAQLELHRCISCAGAIALVTYLSNGSGGGSLARCIKAIDDVIPRQEFMQLVGVVCDVFCSGVKTAVGIEHAIATISEAGESKKPGAKGKEAEDQSMDVDDATAVEPYVRTNYLNLGEVAIAFALETGDFIECISNSLRLGSSDDEGVPRLLPEELSATIVRFVLNMFEVCRGAEPTIAGAQLVDQAIIAIMKAMVFVRHRVYIKLRIFMRFIEENGMPQFCDLLGSMWDWAATLPPPPPPSSLSPQTAGAESTAPAADPDAKLRKALNNTLENMLSIMSFFVDGEPIMECPEYAMLAVEHDERRGWFRPGDMVVGLRLAALPTLQKIWESPLLVYGSSSSLMQSFIACLGPVVCAQHEARTNGSLPGIRRHLPGLMERHGLQSTRRGSGTQTPVPLLARTIGSFGRSSPLARTPVHASATAGPNPMYVSELEAMGFTTEQAEAALTRHSNNLARAANDLLSSAMTGGDRPAESSASAASGQAQGDQPVVSSEAAPEPAEPATASEGGTDSQAPEDSPTAGGAQPTQDSQPMSVDGSRQDPAGSNDDDGAGSANDSGSDGGGSRSNHGRRSPAQKGIEPYSLAEWRAAREAAEDENRLQLQKLRETLRESIAPRVIALVDAFKDQAVPQVRGVLELILRKNESGPATHVLLNAFTPLLDSVSVSGSGDTDERLAAHAYLWAVLLSSSPLMDEMYQHIGGLGQHLIRALGVAIQRQDKTPAWLTTLLLVVELLLVRDSEPPKCALEERAALTQIAKRRLTKLPPSSASINEAAEAAAAAGTSTAESSLLDQVFEPLSSSRPAAGSAFEPLLSTDEDGAPAEAAAEDNRSTKSPDAEPMFDLAQKVELQVLAMQFFADPVPEYTSPVLNALLRLVVVLTRSPEFAAEFMDSGSLANAVRALRTLKPVVLPCITEATAKEKTPLGFVNAIMSVSKDQQKELRQERTLVVHVLRHVIESQPVLRLIMENLIQGWFESPQFSSADVNTYVRGTLAYALRDPAAYTQVTTERCYLPSYNDEMRVSWMTLAWRSTKLLDEEEVDRFEALPEDTLDVPQSTSTDEAEDAKDRKSATDAKAPAEADADAEASKRAEPEQATPGSGFLEYLTQRKQEAPFKPYELDTKSEELACRIVEFVAEEILSLRPPGTIPPISRPATTTDMQAPATPSKQRSSSYAMLSAASAAPSVQAAAAPSDENPETIAYRCFLMQCMAELVASFPFALQAIFVARSTAPGLFSPRKDKGKGKAPAAPDERSASTAQPQSLLRVRSPLISHLVHVLIVREAMTSAKAPKKNKADEPAEGSELDQVVAVAQHQIAMKRGHLSRCVTFWATALLASMCVRHQEGWSTTASRDSPDGAPGSSEITQASLAGSYDKALSAARQLTLDHIVRAFRECLSASASGPGGADVIYARLTSLAQLTYKLVIARAINHGRASEPRGSLAEKPGEREGANALKKMILERGVLDLLTAA
ncbi:E3 ubiquitin-protein ligase tom1, partial [Coemansia sp. RSA 2611]